MADILRGPARHQPITVRNAAAYEPAGTNYALTGVPTYTVQRGPLITSIRRQDGFSSLAQVVTNLLLTTLAVTAAAPFGQIDWPNPQQRTRTTQIESQQSLLTGPLAGTAAAPFEQIDWPNPQQPRRAADYSPQQPTKLVWGKDTFFGGPGQPVANLDWQNPTLRVWTPNGRTEVSNLQQTTLAPPAVVTPFQFRNYDQPNPTLRVWTPNSRTEIQTGAVSFLFLGAIARPIGDTAVGAWLPSSGTALAPMVNEVTPDDTNYIYTVTTATVAKMALSPVANPGTTSGQVVSYRAWSPNGNALTVNLMQGASVIASWTHAALPITPTTYQQALTAGQIASISDYTALSIEFTS